MIVYHGSNVGVHRPRLLSQQRQLDFGNGFYTTTDFNQAKTWSIRTEKIRKNGIACVSVFEIDDDVFQHLKILSFESANEMWLKFVAEHRAIFRWIFLSTQFLICGKLKKTQAT